MVYDTDIVQILNQDLIYASSISSIRCISYESAFELFVDNREKADGNQCLHKLFTNEDLLEYRQSVLRTYQIQSFQGIIHMKTFLGICQNLKRCMSKEIFFFFFLVIE